MTELLDQDRLTCVDSPRDLRTMAAASPDAAWLDSVLDACVRPITYSRHHWLQHKGEYRVRADLRSALEALRGRAAAEWDDEEADLVLSLCALDMSAVGLDELRDRVDSAAVRTVLAERHALYAGVLDEAEAMPRALLELARRVAGMRSRVQRTHELYSIIDGRAWFRTEGVVPRSDIRPDVLAAPVAAALAEAAAPAEPDGPDAQVSWRARLAGVTRGAIAANGESAAVLRAIMATALADPVLKADHVTLTCPMGDMLDRPHEMTTSQAFFTETQLRDGIELREYAERLGHDSGEQLQRTIRARMLKLKRGAIRSLYGPGCMHGQFVEKHGGHMLFRNEDAHYRGHQSIGCSSGGRASFALRYRRDDVERELTPMVGDFRVVRMSQDPRDVFSLPGLLRTICYAEWIKVAVEETYRVGAVLRTDEP